MLKMLANVVRTLVELGKRPGRWWRTRHVPASPVAWVTIPEKVTSSRDVRPVPTLVPPSLDRFTRISPGDITAASRPDLSVASIPSLPPQMREEVWAKFLTPEEVIRSSARRHHGIAYTMLSTVRYVGSGHVLMVSVSEASPTAKRSRNVLGQQTVVLDNGKIAWLTTCGKGKHSTRVMFLDGEHLVTVTGNLPAAEVLSLAAQVVIQQAGATKVA